MPPAPTFWQNAQPTNAPTGAATGDVPEWLVRIAHLMDSAFTLPGTNRKIGLDGVLGIIPGVGDLVGALVGLAMLKAAQDAGVSRFGRARIVGNYMCDTLLGAVPLLGDLFDFAFKANERSLKIIQDHIARQRNQPKSVTAEVRRPE